MKLSVFGLGYVGCVSAACFARGGHSVIGVEVNPMKVEIINGGPNPIVVPGIEKLISKAVKNNLLRATTDGNQAVSPSDVSLVCIGNPANHNSSLHLSPIKRAGQQ